jgi:acyl carrier protein
MTRSNFLGFYEKLWELPEGSLRPEDRLDDAGDWDSLALLNTIALINREFGLKVTGEQLKHCRTFGDILDLANDHFSD